MITGISPEKNLPHRHDQSVRHHGGLNAARIPPCESAEYAQNGGDDCPSPVWKNSVKAKMRAAEHQCGYDKRRVRLTCPVPEPLLEQAAKEEFLRERNHTQYAE